MAGNNKACSRWFWHIKARACEASKTKWNAYPNLLVIIIIIVLESDLLIWCVLQVAGWGADGVIIGSAIVKVLGEAKSPEEGLKELEIFVKSLKSALVWIKQLDNKSIEISKTNLLWKLKLK